MPSSHKLRIQPAEGHVRVDADYARLQLTRAGTVEMQFARAYYPPPNEDVELESADKGNLPPKTGDEQATVEVEERVCTVRMRPDHAYGFAIALMRLLQQMHAQTTPEETSDAKEQE
jgi:hypothetical protein